MAPMSRQISPEAKAELESLQRQLSANTKRLHNLPTYTLEQVAQHNTPDDCWIAHNGWVFKIPKKWITDGHPGGYDIIMANAGTEATKAWEGGGFGNFGHSDEAREKFARFVIGRLEGDPPKEKPGQAPGSSDSGGGSGAGGAMAPILVFLVLILALVFMQMRKSTDDGQKRH